MISRPILSTVRQRRQQDYSAGSANPDVLARLENSTNDELSAIDTFVTAEKDAGNWAVTDEYFILALTDDTDQYIGLKGIDTLSLARGSVTNSGADGVALDNATSSLHTSVQYDELTQYTATEAHVSFWMSAVTAAPATAFYYGGEDTPESWIQQTTSQARLRMNDGTNVAYSINPLGAARLWTALRIASPEVRRDLYEDTTSRAGGLGINTGVPTELISIGGRYLNGTITGSSMVMTMAFFCIGGAIPDLSARVSNVDTLLTALGTTGT